MNPNQYRSAAISLVLLLVFQIWVLNNPYFLHAINMRNFAVFIPMIYPLFLILLPMRISRSTLLWAGFILGFIMDIFCLSYGLHILSCLIAANFRQTLLKNINISPVLLESNNLPNYKLIGLPSFLLYTFLFLLIHHFVYFMLQSFSFSSFLFNLVKIVCSSAFSLLMVILWELVFANDVKRHKKYR